MNQLPKKYKLLHKGKFVGYLKHYTSDIDGICWLMQMRKNSRMWRIVTHPDNIACCELILHDEMRPLIGFQDKNGKDIAFEDLLSRGLGQPLFTVCLDPSIGIIAVNPHHELKMIPYSEFQTMELEED